MTTSDTTDAPEADLVRRTLRAVAAGLDVPDAPLPPEARPGDTDLPGGDVLAGRRQAGRWRAPLAVAAAAVVLAAGLWAVVRSTGNAEDTAPRPPADTSGPPTGPDDDEARATTTAVPPPGGRRTTGPEDWSTLCGARPGDPAMPREEAGERTTGVVAVTGADDLGYELLLWEDRVTAAGPPRSGPCWRLAVGAPPRVERGGGEVVTPAWGPVTALVPVAWTDEETVFFAASRSEVIFVADADVVTTALEPQMEDGTRFWFVRVARDGRSEVTLDLREADGRSVGTAGPLALDGPS